MSHRHLQLSILWIALPTPTSHCPLLYPELCSAQSQSMPRYPNLGISPESSSLFNVQPLKYIFAITHFFPTPLPQDFSEPPSSGTCPLRQLPHRCCHFKPHLCAIWQPERFKKYKSVYVTSVLKSKTPSPAHKAPRGWAAAYLSELSHVLSPFTTMHQAQSPLLLSHSNPLPQSVFVLSLPSARNTLRKSNPSSFGSYNSTFSNRPFLTRLYKLTSLCCIIILFISFLALFTICSDITCLHIYRLAVPLQSKS